MSQRNTSEAVSHKDGEPTDPRLPVWLVPADVEEHHTELGTSYHTGRGAVIIGPGATLSRMEAIRLAKAEEEGRVGTSPLWLRLFPVLWVVASVALTWWLSQTDRTPFAWLQDPWKVAIVLFFGGVLVYSQLVELLRDRRERSKAGAFPTTGSMIAQSSATPTESRARFVSEDIADAVRAIHQRAPQHDTKLRSLVWEWALAKDEATLSRIEKLWKRVDPEGYAKYEADVAED